MALVAAAVLLSTAIYPSGHWEHATKLTASTFEPFVKKQVDEGNTLFVRWIASAVGSLGLQSPTLPCHRCCLRSAAAYGYWSSPDLAGLRLMNQAGAGVEQHRAGVLE